MILLEAFKALIIGIVEGITEWLPISSTGHMILVDEFMSLNVSEAFLELFLVVIQLGAIMAVVILYFNKLNPFSRKKTAVQKKGTWRLWLMVVVGCVPAAVIGIALDDWFNENFYNAVTVAIALVFYGIIFIGIEIFHKHKHGASTGASAGTSKGAGSRVGKANLFSKEEVRGKHARHSSGLQKALPESNTPASYKIEDVDDINVKTALIIGAFQMLAIIPGTSRSGSTIIGGLLAGCSRVAAAEFSFFLAIPVMLGWGILKAAKYMMKVGVAMTGTEIMILVIGIVVAFLVSVAAIKFLVGFVKKHSFIPFGIYRIVVGVLVLAYFAFNGNLLSIIS